MTRRLTPQGDHTLGYDVEDDALELAQAVAAWRQRTGRPCPSWTEVLEILKRLGYTRSGTN